MIFKIQNTNLNKLKSKIFHKKGEYQKVLIDYVLEKIKQVNQFAADL